MTLRMSRRLMFAVPFCAAPSAISGVVRAAEGDFSGFLAGVRRDAIAHGIHPATVDAAFRNAQFLPRVVELDRKQPERTMTFTQYIAKVVTPQRKEDARRQLAENRVLLDAISRRYNVEPSVIVSLWGLESDFGKFLGVDNDWAYRIVKAVGNYGENYEAYFGPKALALPRGWNELYKNGGLQYPLPWR